MVLSRVFFSTATALTLAGLFAISPATAKVLAIVDGVEITDQDVAIAERDIGTSFAPSPDPSQKNSYLLEYLIDLKLVARKADTEKMGEGPDFARQMAYYRDKALMENLLTSVAKKSLTEEALKKVYDEALKAQTPEMEMHARHILVPTEEEAKTALARIRKGEDFGKVASEISKDPSAKEGDLGWFTKDRMVPEFGDAVAKLEPGQVSEPVKTQFGWHIIKLEEKRQKVPPSLDSVRTQLERYVVQKAQAELIKQLHEGAKIERPEEKAQGSTNKPSDASPETSLDKGKQSGGTPAKDDKKTP